MIKHDTWMPLYVGDYLADTMHLGAVEHGAYLLLLMHSWRTGPLPDDDRALANIARCDLATWRRIRDGIRAFFVTAEGGLLQPRLERERERSARLITQRSAAGKASAEARARQREGNERSTSVETTLQRNGRPSQVQLQERKNPPSPPSEARSPQRGSRLPPDWQPDAEMAGFARQRGLDPQQVAAQFCDFWHAKAGKDAVKLDWPATWRGWCRREAERRPSPRAGPGQQSKLAWLNGAFHTDPEPPPRYDLDLTAESIA